MLHNYSHQRYGLCQIKFFVLLATAAARKAASEAGRDGNKTIKANAFTGLSVQEAKQILNINDLEDLEKIRTVS